MLISLATWFTNKFIDFDLMYVYIFLLRESDDWNLFIYSWVTGGIHSLGEAWGGSTPEVKVWETGGGLQS